MEKWRVCAQTARWFDESDHAGSVAFIKKCGFEGLDYHINSLFNHSFDKENLTSFFDKSIEELYAYYADLKEASRRENIPFSQFHGIFPLYRPGQDAVNKYVMEVTEKMLAVCQYLDCHAIVIHPWGSPAATREEVWEINLAMYRQLIPMAKKYGVKICLENCWEVIGRDPIEGTCTDPADACDYVDRLNAEAGEELFGFCLDVGHAKLTARNLRRYINALGKRLTLLHIHDNSGTYDSHMIPYTQMDVTGAKLSIDWEGFLGGLRDIGYEGAIDFETMSAITVIPPELKPAALTYIAEIGKYFRSRLAE